VVLGILRAKLYLVKLADATPDVLDRTDYMSVSFNVAHQKEALHAQDIETPMSMDLVPEQTIFHNFHGHTYKGIGGGLRGVAQGYPSDRESTLTLTYHTFTYRERWRGNSREPELPVSKPQHTHHSTRSSSYKSLSHNHLSPTNQLTHSQHNPPKQ
jgi:hypothetical protein